MEYLKKIKDALKDPKKKSLVLLGIYAIFFIFVFTILRGVDDSNTNYIEEQKNPMDNYKEMNSYEYIITINDNDLLITLDGIYYNNKSLFNYNFNKYYFEGNIYKIDNNYYYFSNIEYNVPNLFNNNISSLFDNLVKVSETIYTNGTKKINYTLDSNIFYKYYFDIDSYYTNTIDIELTQSNNYINNIYFNLENLQINIKSINIKYSSINNINNLEFNKDNYIYIEI